MGKLEKNIDPTSPSLSRRKALKARPAKLLQSYKIHGSEITPGDSILIESGGGEPYVAKVQSIEAAKRGQANFRILWYYRPEDSCHGRRPFHGSKEVFLSDHDDMQSSQTLLGKCKVHRIESYTDLKSVEAEDYFCRFNYNTAKKCCDPVDLPVYCLCKSPLNPDLLMVECNECLDWFHPPCVGTTEEAAKSVDNFVCPNCISELKEIGGDAKSKGADENKHIDQMKQHWDGDLVAKKCHSCAIDVSPSNPMEKTGLTAEDVADISETMHGHEDLAKKLNFKEVVGNTRSKGAVQTMKPSVKTNEENKAADKVKEHWVGDVVAQKCHSCAIDVSPSNPMVEVSERLSTAKALAGISETQHGHEDLANKLKFKEIGGDARSKGSVEVVKPLRSVCVIYDDRMLAHKPPKGHDFVETPDRIQYIYNYLERDGLLGRCDVLNSERAQEELIRNIHDDKYVKQVLSYGSEDKPCGDMYFSAGTSESVLLAAGGVIKACRKVVLGEYHHAFAVVRPPGHHAKKNQMDGFCFFNNIAIGARYLLNNHNVNRILIVDFDVHHGDGTQKIFYDSKEVLFISLHCDTIYPYDQENLGDDKELGSERKIGTGGGIGYNCNVCWQQGIGDDDLYAAWDFVVMPISREFNPDIILISGGFDAAKGDKLGRCQVTSKGYATILNKLLELQKGLVMALEGGYNVKMLGKCASSCVRVLTGDKTGLDESTHYYPLKSTWISIELVRKTLAPYWTCLAPCIPPEITARVKPIKKPKPK